MKSKKVLLVFAALLTLMMGMPTQVYAMKHSSQTNPSEQTDQTESPYFEINNEDISLEAFPLKTTNVDVTISGVIADVYVNQTYQNNGTEPIHATYVFPASTRASVHGMTMTIGNYVVYAQIKEKEEAKQEFEEAKEEGKSASLLEESKPNVFTMNLANIMPGDEVQIELHYSELVIPTDKVYEFVYPTVVGPRYGGPVSGTSTNVNQQYLLEGIDNPSTFNITAKIDAPVPIALVDCTSYDTYKTWNGDSNVTVSLDQSEAISGNKDYVLEYSLAGDQIESGIILHEGEDENFFLLMLEPPARMEPDSITPREYIFVLDISGSMFGFPLDTAKELITDLIGDLNSYDKFNVVLFAGGSEKLSETSLSANQRNINDAIAFIDKQTGGGGTELASALKDAIDIPFEEGYARSLAVITDGYIYEEKEIYEIIEDNLDTANFFSFGIGNSVNRFLIDGIAKAGQGEPFVVMDEKEARQEAAAFKRYIESPILTDIDISFNDFEVYDVEPKTIPTLFSDRPMIIYGKWKGDPVGSVKISGSSGNGDYNKTISLDSLDNQDNGALPYLWARKKIERLADYNPNLYRNKEDIVEIGLKYSILTQHTSFIAVLEEIRNPDGTAADVTQPLPLPEGVSNLAIGNYASMSEPSDILLLALLGSIVTIFILQKRNRNKHEAQRISE